MKYSNVVVAGGGVLGSQIAFQAAYCGFNVTIWLRSEGSIGRTQPKIDHLKQTYIEAIEKMAEDKNVWCAFNMRIQFDSWSKEFILSVKHESVAKVRLGADALGNIIRINNLLESYPEKLAEAEQRLETVQEQMTNAKEEVGKPFPKEEELSQKLERLSELNALLNMDEREDTETEQSESKEKEERPARGSIHEKLQIYKEKSQRESETGKENRKRDFGLE